jgi:hypothetical protein
MFESVCMKTGMCIMATEPILMSYFINPAHSLCFYMRIPLSLLDNGSLYTFPRQRIYVTKKNCWTRRFVCGPCLIKGESVVFFLCISLSLQSNGSVKTFPRQRRIVRGVIFYAVRVVSMESRR